MFITGLVIQSHRAALGAVILTAAFLLGACSTTGSGKSTTQSSMAVYGSFGEPDEQKPGSREAVSLERNAGFFGKMLLVDPLVRPVSTLKAMFGVTLKSTTGFMERNLFARLGFADVQKTEIPEVTRSTSMDLVAWEEDLDSLVTSQRSSGDIEFLIGGEAYFEHLHDSIDNASHSVNLRTYIFDNDDVAVDFADRLRDRADEIEVRILVDGLADLINTRHDSPSMPEDVALPPSIASYLTYESQVQFRKQSNPWFTGDHTKLTVIDEQLAYVGGMNIGREYRYDWHDMMMAVRGPVVDDLQHEFEKAWAQAGFGGDFGSLLHGMKGRDADIESETEANNYPIRILKTTIHDSSLYRAQLEAIRRAKGYIYIQNAYFSDDKILLELMRARRRGVDVRVIVPEASDSGILDLSNQKTINTMLHNGIRVYAYPGMTHVKAAVYDGWACLGSANFDKLSLQINGELNLATSHAPTVRRLLDQLFYADFKTSTELHDPIPLQTRHHLAEFVADEFF